MLKSLIQILYHLPIDESFWEIDFYFSCKMFQIMINWIRMTLDQRNSWIHTGD